MDYKRYKAGFTLVELLIVIAILAILIAMLLPSLDFAREMARERACMANLHNLQLAACAYENDWGTYPLNSGWPPTTLEWIYYYNTEAGVKGGAYWHGGYIRDIKAYHCPNDKLHPYISYSMSASVGRGRSTAYIDHIYSYNYWFNALHGFSPGNNLMGVESSRQMARPSELMIFIEEGKWWDGGIMAWPLTYMSGDASPDAPVLRHYGNFVASFADGSVRSIPVISPRQKTGTENSDEQIAVSWWVYDHPQNLLPKGEVNIPDSED